MHITTTVSNDSNMGSTSDDKDSGLHQKRTLAFINHFVVKTVEFMNNFALQCESRLIDSEMKIQNIEALLTILETKLASIPTLKCDSDCKNETTKLSQDVQTQDVVDVKTQDSDTPPVSEANNTENDSPAAEAESTKDPRYEKYRKMVHFGVPIDAVKLKMIQEGVDPNGLTV